MNRYRELWFFLVILFISSLACNAFAGGQQPLIEPPPTANATIEPTTQGGQLAPTATLPVADQSNGTVRMLVDLNVRSGPGVQYDRVGFLLQDDEAPVIGRHEESGWWLIECPESVEDDQCWVSGGDQFTVAAGVETVAAVDPPPTPTPVPPEIEEGSGLIAYTDNGFLYALQLDLTQSPPLPLGDPIQLGDSAAIQEIALSPDGRRAAYTNGSSEANALFVINVDGQDQRRLAVSEELPLSVEQNAANFTVIIDKIDWLPDNQTILFNTRFTNLVGAGSGSQEDLWSVNLDGQQEELLPAGAGGGIFVPTLNNQILLSRADNILRVAADGTQGETVLEFEPINTASEYIYYPVPQMIEGFAYVGVPSAEPFLPDAQTTLWQIPSLGRAVQLGSVQGANLFSPAIWSPDASRLAYIQQLLDPDTSQPSQLVITDGKGINPEPYASGELLQLHSWSADNNSFLYSGNGFYTVGKLNAPPVQTLLASDFIMSFGGWFTVSDFVTAVGQPQNEIWELQSANAAGSMIPLTEIQGTFPLVDTWPSQ